MRWTQPPAPEYGDRREREVYLWFPKTLWMRRGSTAYKETRWLEQCKVIQIYLMLSGWSDMYWADFYSPDADTPTTKEAE